VTLIEFETKTVQKTVFNIPKSITTQFLYRPAQKPHKNWMIFFHRAGILFNEVQHVNLHNKIISETFFHFETSFESLSAKPFDLIMTKKVHLSNATP
jgi:hypothetical protein